MRGDTNIKYANVTSVDEGIAIMVQVYRERFGKMARLMLIFKMLIDCTEFLVYLTMFPGYVIVQTQSAGRTTRRFCLDQ